MDHLTSAGLCSSTAGFGAFVPSLPINFPGPVFGAALLVAKFSLAPRTGARLASACIPLNYLSGPVPGAVFATARAFGPVVNELRRCAVDRAAAGATFSGLTKCRADSTAMCFLIHDGTSSFLGAAPTGSATFRPS